MTPNCPSPAVRLFAGAEWFSGDSYFNDRPARFLSRRLVRVGLISLPPKREPAPPHRWRDKIQRTRRGPDLPMTEYEIKEITCLN
jgi:hypothetical protein